MRIRYGCPIIDREMNSTVEPRAYRHHPHREPARLTENQATWLAPRLAASYRTWAEILDDAGNVLHSYDDQGDETEKRHAA